ncbi:MAG: phosphopantetheine-binding protein [Deltaproteobacteria bacterium]|nr:phosphopantetheine-binding protein [Deltaproteobacteria bacterium]
MAESLDERIVGLIADHFDLDADDVDDGSFLMDDLGADPYELEELMNLLAEEFDFEAGEDDYEGWETVHDVVRYVADKLLEADVEEG